MRALAFCALWSLAAGPVLAQEPGAGGPRRGGMMLTIEELTTRLKLDSSQVLKIQPLLDKYTAETKGAREVMRANMQAVRNGETTREAVEAENQAAMMVIRDHSETLQKDIRACLTPEQQKTFDEWMAERAQRMQQMRRPPR